MNALKFVSEHLLYAQYSLFLGQRAAQWLQGRAASLREAKPTQSLDMLGTVLVSGKIFIFFFKRDL